MKQIILENCSKICISHKKDKKKLIKLLQKTELVFW